ncbi:MAG: hypothetical protein ACRCZF_19885, partial [Gemmataceae bacterium]
MDSAVVDLPRLRELYVQGAYVQALREAEPLGPLRTWAGVPARLLAGRLALQTGAPKLGRALHAAAFRQGAAYPEAIYYHARYRSEKFGPLACWRFMRRHADWSEAAPDQRADWLALAGFIAGRFKDFDRADRYLNQAEATAPNRPWIAVERAAVFEAAGKLEDALQSARRALELQPWFRPGVQAQAHLLHKMGQTAAAIELLQEARTHLQSGVIVAQLAAFLADQQDYAGADRALDEYPALMPLLEPQLAEWLAARRAEFAYRQGRFAEAVPFARAANDDFHKQFAENLAAAVPQPGPCVLKFTRVDATPQAAPRSIAEVWGELCGQTIPEVPETLAPLADGLPDGYQAHAAIAAGWQAHEFTLDAGIAHQLVEAGHPFLLTVVDLGVRQTRLVVGTDRTRNTISLWDGAERRAVEAPLAAVLERYAAHGPQGLVLIAPGSVAAFDGESLPDAPAYAAFRAAVQQFHKGRLAEALALLQPFRADRSTLPGQLAQHLAARFTAHPVQLQAAIVARSTAFPTDASLQLQRATVLRELGQQPERRAFLEQVGLSRTADPILMQSLAQVWLMTVPTQRDAERLLLRSVRFRPNAAAGYFLLGAHWWEQQRFQEAHELYRLATNLDDRESTFASALARTAAHLGQIPETLRLFQQKATRTATPQPDAVQALYEVLESRDEPDTAFGMLTKAITKYTHPEVPPAEDVPPTVAIPDLGRLLMFRAEQHALRQQWDESEADRTAAEKHLPRAAWLTGAVRLARQRPDLAAAEIYLEEAIAAEPMNPELQRLATLITAETAGKAAARDRLQRLVQTYRGYYPFARMRAEYLAPEADEAAIAATRHLIELEPNDAWALRQLALLLADRERDAEAQTALAMAQELEPAHPSWFAVAAHVHRKADRRTEALATYRAAILADVDHDLAVSELVQLGRGRKEKRAALRFIRDQLRTQPHSGDGLVAYRDAMLSFATESEKRSAEILAELLEELQANLDRRPDLWQSWSLVIQQLGMLRRLDEAREIAEEAIERLPLFAQLWMDYSRVLGALELTEERREALRRALVAAPGWPPASRELAEALMQTGQEAAAVRVLERSLATLPHDPVAHAALADQLWDAGQSEEALEQAKQAVRLDPGFDSAWSMVSHWADRLDRPNEPLELVRALVLERPGDIRSWLKLARMLQDDEQTTEALAALDHAVLLDPRNIEAHDLRAERLADAGRYEEAAHAARPPQLAADLPLVLQGRAAWVEAKRGNYAAAIPPMQALVSLEPNYYWGWQQLAEWYSETGRNAGFLEAASELCRLKPEHPIPLTMRGEARLKTGDRDAGKADLREALRLAAQYAPAAAILFDACLADAEYRDARSALAVLQEHVGGPEVVVKSIQYAVRTQDEALAVRGLREIAESPGDGPPIAMQLAFAEMESAGWAETATTVLKETWKSGEFGPWTPLYWIDTPGGSAAPIEDRLEAAEVVIAAYPKFPPGHDKKAELLAQEGRFDEALAVVRTTAAGDPPPLTLRGRAAWIEARRGRRLQAIQIMRGIVKDDPGYLWGWRNLAQWYDAEGRTTECLEATENMVRLSPTDALSYGYRGEARRATGDHAGARADFARAYELDSSFDAAALHLVAELLRADQLSEAESILAKVAAQSQTPLVLVRGVQVACRRGDRILAEDRFLALLTH